MQRMEKGKDALQKHATEGLKPVAKDGTQDACSGSPPPGRIKAAHRNVAAL
jgi:cytochrome c5